MKVLVVEDDFASSKVLEATLQQLGHEVVTAQNGEEAWGLIQDEAVDAIVCDWMMPIMDGLELCRRVRQTETGEYTYFIMLTARTGIENHHQAMEAGVDDFLTKPLNKDELVLRLRVAERIHRFTEEINQLKKLVPICMYCKKVRTDENYWDTIENYLHSHAGTDFSHGICPECFKKMQAAEAGMKEGGQEEGEGEEV